MATKLLLFEEDAKAAADVRAGLEKLGCDVTLLTEDAFGGGWVVALAAKEPFDVILVAADPPLLNGLSVCDRIKQDARTKSVPVIMLGSDEAALEAHKELPTRADSYVRKPVVAAELAAEIHARLSAASTASSGASPEEPGRGQLASLPGEEIDLDDALVVESNVPKARSIPPPAPPVAAPAETDEDRKRTARSSRVAAREARDQKKLVRELEKEVEALKNRLLTTEREHQAQLGRAEKERTAARTDRELAAKRAEEQARRIDRARADLEEAHEQLAQAAEQAAQAHAAALDARDKAHEQKVARILVEQGQTQAVMLANALRAVREDADAKMASREEEHRVALESQAREHAEAVAARTRTADEARVAELAKADADLDRTRRDLQGKLETEVTRARKLEEDLATVQGARDALARDKERLVLELGTQRDHHDAALEGAAADTRDRVRAVERALGEERATAEADWKAQRLRLTADREEEAARGRALEEELQALRASHDALERNGERLASELDTLRVDHGATLARARAEAEERVGALERKLREERAAAEATLATRQREVVAERDREVDRARVLGEQLAASHSARGELEKQKAEVVAERDRGLDRARVLEEELRASGLLRAELEADEERLVLALADREKEHATALERAAADGRERVRAVEEKANEDRAAAEAVALAERKEIAGARDSAAARVHALVEELAMAEAARAGHDREKARLARDLDAVREGQEAELKKLAQERAIADAENASQRIELVAARHAEHARVQALEEELRKLEAVCADLQRGQESLVREVASRRKEHDTLVRAAREAEEGLRDAEQVLAAERSLAATSMAEAEADLRAQRLEMLGSRDKEAARARALQEELSALQSARVLPELEHLAQAVAAARKDHEAAVARLTESAAATSQALANEKEGRKRDATAHAQALAAASARLERSVQEAESRSVILEAEQAQERLELREAHAHELAMLRQAYEQAPREPPRQRADVEAPKAAERRPASQPPPVPRALALPTEEEAEDTTTIEVPMVDDGEGLRRLLLIARDRDARADLVRALARTGCEVVVRDSCADVANRADDFDVIVTEVVGVGIEKLLEAFASSPPNVPIVASAAKVDATRRMFQSTGLGNVSVVLKASRPDALVAAVRAHLERANGAGANGAGEVAVSRDARRKKGMR